MYMIKRPRLFWFLIGFFILGACRPDTVKYDKSILTVRIAEDVNDFNPITSVQPESGYISDLVILPLGDIHPVSFEFTPHTPGLQT